MKATEKYIEIMEDMGLEVIRIQSMSETMMKRFFGKNRSRIEEVLVVMRK